MMNDETDYIYLAKYVSCSVVDAPGISDCVFCSGCNFACKSCQNRHLWNRNSGTKTSIYEILEKIKENDLSNTIVFTGGECTLQAKAYAKLAKLIKEETDKDIWIYSGDLYENLISKDDTKELLSYASVIVDGRFDITKFDKSRKYGASLNQRVIDLVETMEQGKVVLYCE